MDFFPGLSMLVNFPKVRPPQRDVTLAREKFRNMMNEPTNISRPVLFRTREGLLGKGTKNVRKGDEVWLIAGMPTPVVLRKTESENCFTKTDIVYVHGIMHGEFVDQKGSYTEEIELI